MTSASTYIDRLRKFHMLILLPPFVVAFIIGLLNNLSFIKALLFGTVLSVLIISFMGLYAIFDFIALRIAFRKYGTVDYRIKQYRELEVGLNKNEIMRYAENAINNLGSIRQTKIDENKGIIRAIRRKILGSQGENITLEVRQLSQERSLISIKSEPLRKRAIFDLADNYNNVEKIVRDLKGLRV